MEIQIILLLVNYSRLTPYECQSRELHKINEKVSYLLRSLVLNPYSFWLVHDSHYWIRLVSTPLLLSVYHILKRTIIQNSEYFTRLLFTSLNSIYSVANVLNILYTKTSKIANFQCNIFNVGVIHLTANTLRVLEPRVF